MECARVWKDANPRVDRQPFAFEFARARLSVPKFGNPVHARLPRLSVTRVRFVNSPNFCVVKCDVACTDLFYSIQIFSAINQQCQSFDKQE